MFRLKAKFLGSTEALLHGDLHSGSIMVTETSTLVIDPEFAFYGPMGFDTGLLLANMLFAYFSQEGHANAVNYPSWILAKTLYLFDSFERKFVELWNADTATGCGELHQASFPHSSTVLASDLRSEYMANLWKDTIGFAACEMIRRIVGIAHVSDLDSIPDVEIKARCEKRVLVMARQMMIASTASSDLPDNLRTPLALTSLAKQLAEEEPPLEWQF